MIRGSRAWSLVGWIVSFTTLSTIAVVLRFWSAKIQQRKFYIDDGLIIVAYVGMLTQQGLGFWGLVNGTGNPASAYTQSELLVSAQLLVAASFTWIFTNTAIKLAVLLLYMRVFTTPVFKRCALVLVAATISFGLSFFIVFLTRCHPISQEWNPVAGGWCADLQVQEISSISTNLVVDVAIVLLPLPWLWRLQMPLRNRIAVMIMFSFGFATIALISYRLDQALHSHPDPLLAVANIGLLSNLELWLGIIVACIPTSAPFIRTYVEPNLQTLSRKLYGSASSSSKASKGPPLPALRTFGSSGVNGPKLGSNYTELSESVTWDHRVADEEAAAAKVYNTGIQFAEWVVLIPGLGTAATAEIRP
ncbi:hypothetical protein CIB48_g6888 [Xylaria polymorpha]|nr:hypothetical protein CIB48_g6888 [Xylaria polymorpha]